MSESPSVYSKVTRKARKPHLCCECRGEIRPGESYVLFSGCWDGSWDDYKTCPECDFLRDLVNAEMGQWDEPVAFGDLYTYVFDCSLYRDCDDPSRDMVEWFMATRENRNAPESPKGWMEKRFAELAGTRKEAA